MRAHRPTQALWLGLAVASLTGCSPPPSEQRVEHFLQRNPDWLNQHPALLQAAAQAAAQRERLHARQQLKAALAAHHALLDDPLLPVLGAPRGDLQIIEFSDYRCPPCRASWPALHRLLQHDAGIRLLTLPMPLFGQESELASRAAFAAQRQQRFGPMHEWLMQAPTVDRFSVLAAARAQGLDVDALTAAFEEPHRELQVQRTAALAQAVGVRGLPALIIGDLLIQGGVDDAVLARAVQLARCIAAAPDGTPAEQRCLRMTP